MDPFAYGAGRGHTTAAGAAGFYTQAQNNAAAGLLATSSALPARTGGFASSHGFWQADGDTAMGATTPTTAAIRHGGWALPLAHTNGLAASLTTGMATHHVYPPAPPALATSGPALSAALASRGGDVSGGSTALSGAFASKQGGHRGGSGVLRDAMTQGSLPAPVDTHSLSQPRDSAALAAGASAASPSSARLRLTTVPPLGSLLRVPPQPPYEPRHTCPAVCHYNGCGCGTYDWQGHLVDWVWDDWNRWQNGVSAPTSQRVGSVATQVSPTTAAPSTPRLRIAYWVPHHNVTGGLKMLFQHIKLLHQRGHWVEAIYRPPPIQLPAGHTPEQAAAAQAAQLATLHAIPQWATDAGVKVDSDRLLRPDEAVTSCFAPRDNGERGADVLMVGYFTQLRELEGLPPGSIPGPVVYWEQGSEHLFCDKTAPLQMDRLFHWSFHLPIHLLSVSPTVQDMLACNFGRRAPIIPNAIDCSQFFPLPDSLLFTHRVVPKRVMQVLLVGNPALPFKGFSIAIQTLNAVHAVVPIAVHWICQVKPVVSGARFHITFHVNPPQNQLPVLFRGHDCFLFTSTYEAWGMPVLEAMASGVPVVTSQCHGVNAFCTHGVNALIGPSQDATHLALLVTLVLRDPALARYLAANALRTARALTWDAALTKLEAALAVVAARAPNPYREANAAARAKRLSARTAVTTSTTESRGADATASAQEGAGAGNAGSGSTQPSAEEEAAV